MAILITRPLATAQILADKINQLGLALKPVIFPGIEIIDIQDKIQLDHIHTTFLQFKKNYYNSIIFISPAAVEKFSSYLENFNKQNNNKNNKFTLLSALFCVGKDTALKIQEKNLGQAVFPTENYHSQALLDLPLLQTDQIQYKKILLCQGIGGNTLLRDTLRMRGASVTILPLYQRLLPKPYTLPDLNQIDLIISTSAESLQNILTLLGEKAKTKRWLVSSKKLQLLGNALGLKHTPLLAKQAGDEAILEALKAFSKDFSTKGSL